MQRIDSSAREDGELFAIESDSAFVASTRTWCWRCRASIEVICIYCEEGRVAGELYTQFSVAHVTAVDAALRRQLVRWRHFRLGYGHIEADRYFANHCPRCGSLQADYFLHCEPDGAFFTLRGARPGVIAFTALAGRVRLSGDEGFEP